MLLFGGFRLVASTATFRVSLEDVLWFFWGSVISLGRQENWSILIFELHMQISRKAGWRESCAHTHMWAEAQLGLSVLKMSFWALNTCYSHVLSLLYRKHISICCQTRLKVRIAVTVILMRNCNTSSLCYRRLVSKPLSILLRAWEN